MTVEAESERERERETDRQTDRLTPLKIEEGPMSQGMQAVSKAG